MTKLFLPVLWVFIHAFITDWRICLEEQGLYPNSILSPKGLSTYLMITAQENKTKPRLHFSPVLRFLKIFLTGRRVHASAPLTQVQYSQTELLLLAPDPSSEPEARATSAGSASCRRGSVVFVNKPITWPERPAPRPGTRAPTEDPHAGPRHRRPRPRALRSGREGSRTGVQRRVPRARADSAPHAHARPARAPLGAPGSRPWQQPGPSGQRRALLRVGAQPRRTARPFWRFNIQL
jgi:hypothetical protein